MVICDTNIIIDHLRHSPEDSILIKLFQQHPEEQFAISVVTIQELYEGKSTRKKDEEERVLTTIALLEILPYTSEVARLAGIIARDSNQISDLADNAIAATAILNGARLFTLNTKDFKGIKDLELV